MTSLSRITIDDDLCRAAEMAIEVTIELSDGSRRWCFFFTPAAMKGGGDWVDGTRIPFHLGVPHMIVVAELSEDIIRRILESLDRDGMLEAHTVPLDQSE